MGTFCSHWGSPELQKVTDALQAHGIQQTAIHKHLLSHKPEVWWTHIHAMGRDATAIARSVRAALDVTATPIAPVPAGPAPSLDLDTAALDRAMGAKGTNDGGTDDDAVKLARTLREAVAEQAVTPAS
ncbi:DUF1259 domain-containing protein [Nonomuraea pusilla]|uniref:DUF1259 domain-containing protein n=1 Tax=Nonomuraea pusilla TaxID=46177 RepID=UPI00332AF635